MTVLYTVAGAPVADLPFARRGHWIVLSAGFGNSRIDALLDTGAGASVIEERLARSAGFKPRGATRFWGIGSSSLTGRFLDGLTVDLAFAVPDLPILYTLPLGALADSTGRIDAILGGDFFERYVVEIDPAESRIRLYDPESYCPPEGLASMPMQFVEGAPTVEGKVTLPGVGTKRVAIALDTGSQFGVDVGYRMVVRDGLEAHFPKGKTAEVSGGIAGTRRARSVGPIEGSLGPLPFRGGGRLILQGRTDTTRPSGLSYGYDVTLGGEALRAFRLVFDYSRGTLYAAPSGLK